MIIGIDASMLVYQGSGVANYTYNLVKNLLLYDKKNEYRIFYSSFRKPKQTLEKLQEIKKLGGKVFIYHFPPKFLNLIWGKFHILPIEWLIGKCDIIFFSDFLRPPTLKGTKGITTIHDLTWKIYPQYHTKEIITAHEIKLKKTIKYKDEIIVDSKNTKNDLLKFYPQINKKKIHVIYPGIDIRFKPINDKKKIEKVLKKYLNFNFSFLNFKYLLYVGAIEPRKNLDIAIKIFHQLINLKTKKHTSSLNLLTTNLKFLIIGRAGWKNEKIFSLIKKLKLEDKIIFLGYVEDEDLPYFYSQALATIYLSEYEGFGLPPIESAYCQTPVLLYKNSSLKELFKDKYPYAKKGEELQTLIYLIKNKINPKKYLRKDFNWKNFIIKFKETYEKN